MKITQLNDQMNIKAGGYTQLILGITFVVVGIAIAGIFLSGTASSDTGEPPTPWLIAIGAVFIIAGVLTVLSAKHLTIGINTNGSTIVSSKRLIGGKVSQRTFPTSSIAAVELITTTEVTSSNDQQPARKSRLALLLTNNDRIEVATASSSNSISVNDVEVGMLFQKAPLGKEADQIARFLNLPVRVQ